MVLQLVSVDWLTSSLSIYVWHNHWNSLNLHFQCNKLDQTASIFILCSSAQFSSVTQLSLTLQPHGLQHARLPCALPIPRAYSNSCPPYQWCHPTISSSFVPFSSGPQSFLASGSFPMSQFFASGGQSISFTFSINPSNEYSGLISFRIDWLDGLAVQGTLKSLLQHHSTKASILQRSAFFIVQLSHPYMTTGKARALTRQTFADKVLFQLFFFFFF